MSELTDTRLRYGDNLDKAYAEIKALREMLETLKADRDQWKMMYEAVVNLPR